jgi:cytochrome c oxidase subunit 4
VLASLKPGRRSFNRHIYLDGTLSRTEINGGDVHDDMQHTGSMGQLIGIWGLLLLLTAATVGISRIHLGAANIWAALGIATAKATLVTLFFMHLKKEGRVIKISLLVTLATLATFIGLTFFDVLYR